MQALTITEIKKAVLANTNNWDDFDHLNIKEFRTHAMHIMVMASSMTIEKNKGFECQVCAKRKEQSRTNTQKTNAKYITKKNLQK